MIYSSPLLFPCLILAFYLCPCLFHQITFLWHVIEGRSAGNKFLVFVCLKNSTCPSLLKDNFSGYRILSWSFFIQPINYSVCSFLTYIVYEEKPNVILIFVVLQTRPFFPLPSFKNYFLFLVFCSPHVIWLSVEFFFFFNLACFPCGFCSLIQVTEFSVFFCYFLIVKMGVTTFKLFTCQSWNLFFNGCKNGEWYYVHFHMS